MKLFVKSLRLIFFLGILFSVQIPNVLAAAGTGGMERFAINKKSWAGSAPVANNNTYTTPANTTFTGSNVLTNDTDADGETLTAVLVSGTTNGSLTLNADGTFIYLPNAGFSGTDIFTYRASDGSLLSATATVTIRVPNPYFNTVSNPAGVITSGAYDCFRLTAKTPFQTVAIWRYTTLDLNRSFNLTFQVKLSDVPEDGQGDGIAFALQRGGINTLGGTGSGMGISSVSPSVAVEFDTFRNGSDIPADHTAVDINGNLLAPEPGTLVPLNPAKPNVEDGLYHDVRITWDRPTNTLKMYFDNDPAPRFTYVNDIIANVFSGNANVNWGFTAANGGSFGEHHVCNIRLAVDNPSAIDDPYYTVNEDGVLNASSVLNNDLDPNGNVITPSLTSSPANGTFTWNPDGTFVYTPNPNFNGTATFKYSICDNGTPSLCSPTAITTVSGTVTITVKPVNDAPVFTKGASQTISEDAPAQTVTGWATGMGDGDPELTQTLTFITTNTNPALFSVQPSVAANGTLTYTPAPNANGVATVTVVLQDNGASTTPNINTSTAQTFTITVNPVNDGPVFTKGADQTVNEDAGMQTVPSWATGVDDSDPELNQILTFTVTNTNNTLFSVQPSVAANGTLTYTPAPNANGVVTVTLRLQDNGSGTAPNVNQSTSQTFTITVNAVNDAPQAANNSYATNQGVPLNVPTPGVLANDTDPENNPLTAVLGTPPGHGTLSLNANGSFTYSSQAGFFGTDAFTYRANDGNLNSGLVTVTITVNSAAYQTNGNAVSSGTNCFRLTNDAGNNVGTVWAKIPADLNNSFELSFDALFSAPGLVKNQGGKGITFGLQQAGVNVINSSSSSLALDKPYFTVEFDTYQDSNEPIEDHIQIAQDGNGGYKSIPRIIFNNNIEDGNYHAIKIIWSKPASTMQIYFDGVVKAVYQQNIIASAFNNNPNVYWGFKSTTTGSATNQHSVCDIQFTVINDAPVAISDAATGDEDTSISGNVLTNDSDPNGNALTITALTNQTTVEGGKLSLLTNGDYTYLPAVNFTGTDSFTYEVCDNGSPSKCSQATVTITVNPVNDAPVFTKGADQTVNEDAGMQTVPSWATGVDDSDPELDQVLTFTASNNNNALFAVQPAIDPVTGNLTYTPALNTNGIATVTITLSDNGLSAAPNSNQGSPQTFTITVVSVNDTPLALNDSTGTKEGQMLTGASVLVNDKDAEGDPLTISLVAGAGPANGILALNPDGTYTYTPNPEYFGTDGFTYEVCDNYSACSQATVTITVEPHIELIIYEGISPNGDGLNDYWHIEDIGFYPSNRVSIYDRWGKLVFDLKGYDNGERRWAGERNQEVMLGKDTLSNGTYFYVVNLGDGSAARKGKVVIKEAK